jgi:dihydroorotate dehydrogenase (fumarate)
VKQAVQIPIAVKLSPYFSAIGHMAERLVAMRSRRTCALQPLLPTRYRSGRAQLDAESRAQHAGGNPLAVALDWRAFGRLKASLAASTGVETSDEVIKYLLAGATPL